MLPIFSHRNYMWLYLFTVPIRLMIAEILMRVKFPVPYCAFKGRYIGPATAPTFPHRKSTDKFYERLIYTIRSQRSDTIEKGSRWTRHTALLWGCFAVLSLRNCWQCECTSGCEWCCWGRYRRGVVADAATAAATASAASMATIAWKNCNVGYWVAHIATPSERWHLNIYI